MLYPNHRLFFVFYFGVYEKRENDLADLLMRMGWIGLEEEKLNYHNIIIIFFGHIFFTCDVCLLL